MPPKIRSTTVIATRVPVEFADAAYQCAGDSGTLVANLLREGMILAMIRRNPRYTEEELRMKLHLVKSDE